MSVSLRHLFRQGAVLKSLLGAATSVLTQKKSSSLPDLPGPWLHDEIEARSPRLVVDYIRWTGGTLGRYEKTLPPHLFPQWGFPLIAQTLQGIPYPLTGVLNQGCKITVHHALPADQPLILKARLESVEEDEKRARLHQRLVTGTHTEPESIVADVYAVVRLKSSGSKKKRDKPSVPEHAVSIGKRDVNATAGRDFALLTGDFNPIHWIRWAAKLSGFKSTILHGFASLSIAIEQLNGYFESEGHPPWKSIDVRFVRPLVLPNTAQLYITLPNADSDEEQKAKQGEIFLTDKNGEICMLGQIEW